MSWHKFALNPITIENFYDSVPLLEEVEVLKVALNREASVVSLVFNLAIFPPKPPAKWKQAGFNTVQVGLDLIEVSSLNISGWGHSILANISIAKGINQIELTLRSDVFNLTASFDFMRIGVSGYLKAE